METQNLKVQNIKCSGCSSSIVDELSKIPGVQEVNVDIDSSTVTINHDNSISFSSLKSKLNDLGYPLDESNLV